MHYQKLGIPSLRFGARIWRVTNVNLWATNNLMSLLVWMQVNTRYPGDAMRRFQFISLAFLQRRFPSTAGSASVVCLLPFHYRMPSWAYECLIFHGSGCCSPALIKANHLALSLILPVCFVCPRGHWIHHACALSVSATTVGGSAVFDIFINDSSWRNWEHSVIERDSSQILCRVSVRFMLICRANASSPSPPRTSTCH